MNWIDAEAEAFSLAECLSHMLSHVIKNELVIFAEFAYEQWKQK